ncbi:MAG: hypothetical protein ABI811_17610 [Acidobacteriota bacterium]
MKRLSCVTLLLAFVLTAAGQAPPVAPAKPTRVVPPVRIMDFSAKPTSIQAGQPVLLSWLTENPNSVSIDPGVGRVTARGSHQVTPTATTTYVLSVGGPDNTTLTKTLTVTVTGGVAAANPAPSPAKNARLPGGQPDFSGVYGFAGLRNAMPPALKPGAEKYRIVRQGNQIRGNTTLTTGSDCNPLGVPQSFVTPYPIQFVHTPKLLVMMFEYPNTFRIIPTDGRAHPTDPDPTFMGDAVARWDGDTLVVDTIGFNEKTEVSGFMHSEALHVIERYRKTEDGSLLYDVTVEDPNVWVSPWVMPQRTLPLRPELERIDEFVCESTPDYSKFFAK